jgi:protein-S-isoprenylcysteine O-methyltransferase Ste14
MPDTTQERGQRGALLPPPPLLYAAVFAMGLLLQRLWPLPALSGTPWRTLALVLGSAGLVLGLSGFSRFMAARTTFTHLHPSRALVIRGPYRFTRNPMYIGLMMVYVACCLWTGHAWPLLLTPLGFLWIDRRVVRSEERHLRQRFGPEYERYLASVRRWI